MPNVKKSPQAVPEISHPHNWDELTIQKHNASNHGYLQCRQLLTCGEKRKVRAIMKNNLSHDSTGGRRWEKGLGEDRMAERQFKSAAEKSEVFLRLRLRAWRSGFLRRTSGVKQDTGRETPSWQVDSLIPVTLNYVGNLHCSMQSQAERGSHMLKRKPV